MACAFAATGAVHATTISISPATQTASLGSVVQVDLDISGVNSSSTPALAAWDINVSADPTILSFSSAAFGTNVDVSGLGDIQNVSTPASGTTELYEISLDPTDLLTSLQPQNFTLVTLYFDTVGTGTNPLNISINSLSDGNGNPIGATVVPGSVTITSPVPLPASVWPLSSALLALLAVSRVARVAPWLG
jgi:hypothetical protein